MDIDQRSAGSEWPEHTCMVRAERDKGGAVLFMESTPLSKGWQCTGCISPWVVSFCSLCSDLAALAQQTAGVPRRNIVRRQSHFSWP